MAKKVAKVKSTGGYGFTLEDKVAATCLIRMLDGLDVFGIKDTTVQRLSFQVRASGWLVDDLLLQLGDAAGDRHCAVSVKSSPHLTTDGFKPDFVSDLWEQWRNGSPFDQNRDFFALAVGRLSDAASAAWEEIARRTSLGDPQHLADQLTTKGSSSRTERNIFASLLPEDERKRGSTALDAARLLARIVVQHFGPNVDTLGICDCTSLLVAEKADLGKELWEKLQAIASRLRVAGGTVDLTGLLEQLRNKYRLTEHPEYRASWHLLNDRSRSNCNAVYSIAGANTTITFGESEAELRAKTRARHVLAIVGDSGTGKSSLTKRYVQSSFDEVNLIWLSQEELATQNQSILASSVGSSFELPELIRHSSKPVLLVADAIEQFSALAMRRLSELVVAMQAVPELDYRVLLTTQPLRWEGVRPEVFAWNTEGVDDLLFSGPAFENVLSALSRAGFINRFGLKAGTYAAGEHWA